VIVGEDVGKAKLFDRLGVIAKGEAVSGAEFCLGEDNANFHR
jgi:hypothetical protein